MANPITEDQLQAACFKWFDNTYPQYRGTLFAVPNGGERDKREANKFKATGVVAGVSDMILVLPCTVEFIEFKIIGNHQDLDQIQFMNRVKKLGHGYTVLFSFVEFRVFIETKIKEYYGKE